MTIFLDAWRAVIEANLNIIKTIVKKQFLKNFSAIFKNFSSFSQIFAMDLEFVITIISQIVFHAVPIHNAWSTKFLNRFNRFAPKAKLADGRSPCAIPLLIPKTNIYTRNKMFQAEITSLYWPMAFPLLPSHFWIITSGRLPDKSSTSVDKPSFKADFVSGEKEWQNILKVGLTVNFPLNINTIKTVMGKNEAIIEANEAPQIGVLNAIKKSGSKQTIFNNNEQTWQIP